VKALREFAFFFALQFVSSAKGRAALAGYVLGGAVGSVLTAWITKKIYGQ
jgi:hypothetical protein